jgi:hypothetical protein
MLVIFTSWSGNGWKQTTDDESFSSMEKKKKKKKKTDKSAQRGQLTLSVLSHRTFSISWTTSNPDTQRPKILSPQKKENQPHGTYFFFQDSKC